MVLRPLSVAGGGEALTKNEIKRRAKQLEKEKKAAEKAARQAELAKQREAADVVRPIIIDHTIYAYSSVGRRCPVLRQIASQSVSDQDESS